MKIEIELLLTVLSDFEREGVFEDSAFWLVVFLTHTSYWDFSINNDNKFEWLSLVCSLKYPMPVVCAWIGKRWWGNQYRTL